MNRDKLLPMQSEWTPQYIEQFTNEIDRIATEKYKLDVYPNQLEIITSEQMMDAYSSHGMPIFYNHWSFGKSFITTQKNYMSGNMNLAYEIVINSNPCISYLMEDNTLPMQALVIAHAAYGHNAVFKNNYLFKARTEADSILDFLSHAQKFIRDCEQKYGEAQVEYILDACHTLRYHAFDHHIRPEDLSKKRREQRQHDKDEADRLNVDEFWSSMDRLAESDGDVGLEKFKGFPEEPEENILQFIEKYSPNLELWQKEIVRIVRTTQEYFYPQMQTKVVNEGFATFMHYNIMHDLSDEGLVDEGFMLEILASHTGVVNQAPYYYPGVSINPYALGFNIFQDIKRICTDPTDEDRQWFPQLIGRDWIEVAKEAAFEHRDDSFIAQYLSPKVIRDMKLFNMVDDSDDSLISIPDIHNEQGYQAIREQLAKQHNILNLLPSIEVDDVQVRGDRTMTLAYTSEDGTWLDEDTATKTCMAVSALWGFDVVLLSRVEKDGEYYGSDEIMVKYSDVDPPF